MEYFLKINGQLIGPMTARQVFAYDVNSNTALSSDFGETWRPLYTYPELMQILNSHRREGGVMEDGSQTDSKRILCGIMAILLGGLGIQYFVIGKTAGGLLTILLSIVTCGLWEIVTFIQGIMMLCMSDSEFKRKYVDSPSKFPLF